MPKGQRRRTEAEKAAQKTRTHYNQIKKYKKLIEQNPDDIHVPIWKDKINKLNE